MEGLIAIVALAVFAVPVLLVVLIVAVLRLRTRVDAVERELFELRQAPASTPQRDEPTLADLVRTPPVAPARPVEPTVMPPPPIRAAAPPVSGPPPLPPEAPRVPPRREPPRPYVPAPPRFAERATDAVRRWFTEGNLPAKVGMLVLFAGVAALLKYAADEGLLRLPIELRLAGIALAAIAALGFGWCQRIERRMFGLVLQGGAVGVLLLVLFAAAKLYALVSVGAAFGLSVALVAGLGVLAVRQESLALAVLGVLAGFLAPIWLSTGEGNHVALFGYYAVLNGGIVAIAWRRPWRLLNLMGFAFTFGIGSLWGALRYRPEDFATTEPFLVLFFAMYLAIPILYSAAKGPVQRRILDGSLVFGTPLVAFALQAGLLRGEPMQLAFCALGVAAVYALLAAVLRGRATFAALVAPYAVLAIGFATLAVPLALSARATAAVFALEGAGLVWLGLRQSRSLPQLAGLALQLVGAAAFAVAPDAPASMPAVLNSTVMTALLIAVAGFATALAARRHEAQGGAAAAYVWALAWWLGAALFEIDRSVPSRLQPDAVLGLALLTGLVASEVARRLPARALSLTGAMALVAPLALVWWQADAHHQPLAGLGGLAWLAFGVVAWRVSAQLRDEASSSRGWAHVAAWASAALLASISLFVAADDARLGDAWRYAGAVLPWLALGATLAFRPQRLALPFDADDFAHWQDGFARLVGALLGASFVVGLFLEAGSAPLPHVPLVNPLELAQLGMLVLAWRLAAHERGLRPLVAGAVFAFATSIVLRAVHHWGGVAWDASMFSTGLVQTSLTVLWSLMGMLAWVSGSRRQRRELWQAGAVLLAVVLGKLVLVDRQYLGDLLGIGSFIAFGLLCTAVGYLAPVPPRETEAVA
ncbi:DUF2339 domain-containing protein [Lysobacter xanthus]